MLSFILSFIKGLIFQHTKGKGGKRVRIRPKRHAFKNCHNNLNHALGRSSSIFCKFSCSSSGYYLCWLSSASHDCQRLPWRSRNSQQTVCPTLAISVHSLTGQHKLACVTSLGQQTTPNWGGCLRYTLPSNIPPAEASASSLQAGQRADKQSFQVPSKCVPACLTETSHGSNLMYLGYLASPKLSIRFASFLRLSPKGKMRTQRKDLSYAVAYI